MTVTYPGNRQSGNSAIHINQLAYADSMLTALLYVIITRLYTATTYVMRFACGEHRQFSDFRKRVFTFSEKSKNRLYISTTYAMPPLLLLNHLLRDKINTLRGRARGKISKRPKARAG